MKRALLAGMLFLLGGVALAQPGPPPGGEGGQGPDPEAMLGQAEKYYEALEYEAALKILIAVQQMPGVTPMQKARAFLYMGVCFTALGNAENAVASFVELLKVKPTFRLPPGISPSIHAMFKEALKRLKLPENAPPEGQGGPAEGAAPGQTGVGVEASTRSPLRAGQAVDVNIEITDPQGHVEDVVLHWRLVGGPDFSVIRVKYKPGKKKVTARIPGAVTGSAAGKLQYVVEVLGRGGLTLAHAGTHGSPLEVELEASGKKRSSRWGWYLLGFGGGAAVIGGIIAAILLTRDSPPPPQPSTANVSVTID